VIGDLAFESRDARRDLSADRAHAVDADLAADIAGLRAHQRRWFCVGPVAAADIVIGGQQAARCRQHQRHRDVGDRGGIRTGTVADRDTATRGFRKIDAVVAGAVADDRLQRR
jgi:hypothetical protein